MTKLLAQHGAAKGQKITDSLEMGDLKGAVFSPNDERIASIIKYVSNTPKLNFQNTFLDPQFYFSTYDATILKKLSDITTYPSNITRRDWRKKSLVITDYIDEHAKNTKYISGTLIVPGFYIENVDWHFDYSIEMYNYAIGKYGFEHYALSLLIHTNFFSNKANIDELIEEIEDSIELKDYIYMTVCHDNNIESNYEEMDSQILGNIMYAIYRLRKSGFKVIMGYTFMNSVLFSILDCEFVASGWFNTLRKFQKNRFDLSDKFGRRKKRYTSIPLLSYIMFDDIKIMLDSNAVALDDILSGTRYDEQFRNDSDSLSFVDLEHQYWESLSIGLEKIEVCQNIQDRIQAMRSRIKNAISLYKSVVDLLEKNGEKEAAMRIKTVSKHLVTWLDAIDGFRQNALII